MSFLPSSSLSLSKHIQRSLRASTPMAIMATPPPSSPVKREDEVDLADEEPFKQPDHYPKTELEWMATSAFNLAIDYYVADDDANCTLWAEKAMTVAQWLEDDGQLRDTLMKKYAALQLNR
jgi:hypothetical protein